MNKTKFNSQQLLFKEMFVGTLIYAVLLGFFNDYTNIVNAKSFSTIFYAAFVLQTLTYSVFMIKGKVFSKFSQSSERKHKFLMIFTIWFILFVSKFIFIWVIDFIFGSNINISGFFGILILALAATVLAKLSDYIFKSLGEKG